MNILVVGDLKRHCDRPGAPFNILIKYLGLPENMEMTLPELRKIVERNFRESYFLRKNVMQMMHAAYGLKMILKSLVLLVIGFLVVIKGWGDLKMATGIFSAMFGVGILFRTRIINFIDSAVLIFVIHPFDIGDRVFIRDGNEYLNLTVDEINLFSTIFYQWDGAQIHYPNTALLEMPIINIRRSRGMFDSFDIDISNKTETNLINQLKARLISFLETDKHSFTGAVFLSYEGIEDMNKLKLKIWIQFRSNWQNYDNYLARRSKIIVFINDSLKDLKIDYEMLVNRLAILSK